ncbi:MAG: hypothetical protein LBU34_04630 [Planctomycetaceae bacterium]|jgi:hypothetical protein|nr:hypothetical protein [Planctomycetaceae bacterium]
MQKKILLFLFLPAILAVVLTGCAEKRQEVTITGTVSVAGKPVDGGMIQFLPADKNSFEGGGIIDKGKFIATVPYGDLYVRFRGNEYLQKDADGNPLGGKDEIVNGMRTYTPPPSKQIIPDRYWFNSEVKVTVKTGKEPFDFNLEGK